jgi:hypothetical protein
LEIRSSRDLVVQLRGRTLVLLIAVI